mmetsp:Transcript_3713/g.3147  ORF Transcript_3713/g.3147 Transcript_3713/m.3147 type:complete len:90 (-) Transcript_3713:229-498(-)
MESRSYNFSTANKRSTMLSSKIIYFPRWDDQSPRVKILSRECPDTFKDFKDCMNANNNDENICFEKKQVLNECAVGAFNKANSDPNYPF